MPYKYESSFGEILGDPRQKVIFGSFTVLRGNGLRYRVASDGEIPVISMRGESPCVL